jgi:hypothetical protein
VLRCVHQEPCCWTLIKYLGEYWREINSWLPSVKNTKVIELSEILSPVLVDTVSVNHKSKEIAAEIEHRRSYTCGYHDLQDIVMQSGTYPDIS